MNKKVAFLPATVQQLKAQLDAAGPDAVLFVSGAGKGTTLQVVVPATAFRTEVRFQPLNDAHLCPGPKCPE